MLKASKSWLADAYGRHLRERIKELHFRWLVLAKRVQPAGPHAARGEVDLLESARHYAPIAVQMPLFRIDHPSQTGLLKHYLDNPNLKPFSPFIVAAKGVTVSAPAMIHRWRGMAFVEGLLGDPRNMSYPRVVRDFESLPLRPSSVSQAGVLLALPLYSNYYHWMIELLPRLQLLDEHPQLAGLPLLLPAEAPGFVQESLRLAGCLGRIQLLARGAHRFEQLYIPTLLSPPSHPAPYAVSWLRSNLGQRPLEAPRPRKRRIYISRRDAPSRFASNERQVEALLAGFGFETVIMSDFSLEGQIALFSSAEMVVGLHGASLTNLAFSDTGTYVIELFMAGWFTNAFYHIAMIRGHHYGYLVCPQDGAGQHVPIPELETLMHRVFEHAAATQYLLTNSFGS
jgi:capsular polysaccharide biosynthesis protein